MNQEHTMDYEETIVGIIANSGNAHSCAMEAIGKAKERRFDEADELLSSARESLVEAQKIHGAILSESVSEGGTGTPLLTVHAEDQIMAAFSAIDMAQEFRRAYELIFSLADEVEALRMGR